MNLYPKVSAGGYIYVDDYGSFWGCRLAVNRYRKQHGITDRMWPVFETPPIAKLFDVEAVWWRKGSGPQGDL